MTRFKLLYLANPNGVEEVEELMQSLRCQAVEECQHLREGLKVDIDAAVEKTYQDIGHLVILLDLIGERTLGHLIVSKSSPSLVKGIYVTPEYRRKGWGKKMLQHLQDKLSGAPLSIGVLEGNTVAIKFFEGLGYEVRVLSYS